MTVKQLGLGYYLVNGQVIQATPWEIEQLQQAQQG